MSTEDYSEDYCSFEVAKLLKENGFDWMCNGYYNKDDEDSEPYFGDGEGADNWNNQAPSVRDLWFSAPTYQMAMRFLREIKKIFINIRYVPESKDDNIGPCYVVDIYSENNDSWVSNHIVSTSFEVVAEESLIFCLTKLI